MFVYSVKVAVCTVVRRKACTWYVEEENPPVPREARELAYMWEGLKHQTHKFLVVKGICLYSFRP
jgi:uncharacterized membrane protein